MNPQSRGTVTLRSADPKAAPIIDPKFLTHPFDRRMMIDGIRETKSMLSAPVFASEIIKTLGPKDDSEEARLVSRRSEYLPADFKGDKSKLPDIIVY